MAAIWKSWQRFYSEKVIPFMKDTTTKRIFVSVLFFIIFTSILASNFNPYKFNFKVGTAAPKTIIAQRSVVFEDKKKTEEARNKAAEQVNKVYEKNPKVAPQVQDNITAAFQIIRKIQGTPNVNTPTKVQSLKEQLPMNATDKNLTYMINTDAGNLQKIQETTSQVVNIAYQSDISEEALAANKKQIKENKINTLPYETEYKVFMGLLIDNYLQPNIKYNDVETKNKIEEAKNAVNPVRVTVQQGEKIVGEGEIITDEVITKLQNFGLQRQLFPYRVISGIILLVIISMFVVLMYLYQYRKDIFENDGYLLLLAIISAGTLLIAKLIVLIDFTDGPVLSGYLAPISLASILIAILLDKKLAILVTAILSIFLGVMTDNQLAFTIVGLIGGIVAIYGVSKLSRRSDLAKAGLFYISGANLITIIAVVLVTTNDFNSLSVIDIILLPIMAVCNGVFSAILAGGTLPFLETAFGITSVVKLLELSNPNEPLLKRVLLEAPGTYHHSIIVGNMAEAAADVVGADSLLARAGAYYHDVGKVKRPYFFIENQLSNDNPHDKIYPSLSTLIITSHIKDGVEMAKEQKLPKNIVDIIEQHHGTSLVTYFYYRATENDKNETVAEEDFRYEGPKPQTKEAALVMLADSVEAAARAMQKPTPGRIEGLVRKIIKEKLNDGQLDECDLTFKDLDIIANTFVRVLSGIFHSRIEYPENVIKEMERRKNRDANLRK